MRDALSVPIAGTISGLKWRFPYPKVIHSPIDCSSTTPGQGPGLRDYHAGADGESLPLDLHTAAAGNAFDF
jgi:hypothetical protein